MKYKYKLSKTFIYCSKIKLGISADFHFRDQDNAIRFIIRPNNHIEVVPSYAWDGCTPKINVLDLFWLGVPDGIINEGLPLLYYKQILKI